MPHPLIRALLLVCVLLISGCAGQPAAPTAVPTPTPTPRELAAQIGSATQQTQSMRFTVALSGKAVFADPGGLFTLTSMEGDLKRPDGMLATLKVKSAVGVAELRSVSLSGKQYLTNPITRQWQCLQPGGVFDPVILFETGKGLDSLIQQGFDDVALLGTEDLNGKPHYHLRGTMDGKLLQPISFNLLGIGPVQVDVWADQETRRATQIILVDTATDPASPSTWTMNFSDYDKPVDVRAPISC